MVERYADGTPKLKPTMCVECGIVLNATSPTSHGEDDAPAPGAVSLCINCGHLSLFDELLRLREPTAEEWLDPELHSLQGYGRRAALHFHDDRYEKGRA